MSGSAEASKPAKASYRYGFIYYPYGQPLSEAKAKIILESIDDQKWVTEAELAQFCLTPQEWTGLTWHPWFSRAKRKRGKHSYRLSEEGARIKREAIRNAERDRAHALRMAEIERSREHTDVTISMVECVLDIREAQARGNTALLKAKQAEFLRLDERRKVLAGEAPEPDASGEDTHLAEARVFYADIMSRDGGDEAD